MNMLLLLSLSSLSSSLLLLLRATVTLRAIVARRRTGRQRQTTKCVLPLTHVDLFKSLRTALTLIKTMQPRGANVICVRLRTRKLTRRPRTVPDNDKAASPDLHEQIACV